MTVPRRDGDRLQYGSGPRDPLELLRHDGVQGTHGWAVLLPLKQLAIAKSRLAPLPPPLRASLALAMALDTAEAALLSPLVNAVWVNCNDPAAVAALTKAGCHVVPDAHEGELNTGLAVLAAHVRTVAPNAAVAALTADVPAVRAADLTHALVAAGRHPRAYVADVDGSGTTLLTARAREGLRPAYGPGSSRRHRRSGAAPLLGMPVRVRRDVDTVSDLFHAHGLGLGRHSLSLVRPVMASLVDAAPATRRPDLRAADARPRDVVLTPASLGD